MNRRTEEQIRAYIDGYRDCFDQFCKCLQNRRSVPDSIRKMSMFLDAVVNVGEANEKGRKEND